MGDDLRVLDWGEGLPNADDLTPLSQILITPELAAAFGLAPEPQRSLLDVHCASMETLEALCRGKAPPSPGEEGAAAREGEGEVGGVVLEDGEAAADDPTGRGPKRPRLLWTPHLHKRFVDVVAHLGVKKAVPKTIMQLMNVEGLTRENVASHLQKYRLYLKRSSGDGESSSDQMLTPKEDPVPHPAPAYPLNPTMIPVLGGGASIGMLPVNGQMKGGHYPWYASHHPYVVYGRPA